MKNGLFFLLVILFSCSGNSQKISKKDIYTLEKDKETGWLRGHNKQNKWGFINKDSIVVIPFEYDFLNPFDENKLVYGKKNGKELYVDITGKVIIPPIYDKLGLFSEGLVAVKKNGKTGYFDTKGNIEIPFLYESFYSFYQGLAIVSKDNKFGLIDKTGKIVIPIVYDGANQSHTDKIVVIERGEKWAFFDNQGNQLSDFKYDKIFSGYNLNISPSSNLSAMTTFFKNGAVLVQKNNQYEFLNEKIEPAFPNNKFDSATVFDTYQNAIVKRSGKYGMIKPNGELKVPLEYDYIEYYDKNHISSEYYNARKGNIYSIISQNLDKIGESYQPIYNNFKTNNLTISFKNLKGKYGVVDRKGNIKVPFIYDEELYFEGENYAIATRNNEVGLIDSGNKILIPFGKQFLSEVFDRFDEKPKESPNYFIVANNKTAKIVDINNKTIINGYQSIRPIFYDHSKFLVKRNNKLGVVDLNNKILSPIIYDEFSDWVEYGPENRHIVKLGSKSGMLEYKTFKEKIPAIYDFVFVARDKVFVGKNKKYGIIDLNNKILCPLIYDELKSNFGYGLGFGDDKIYARKANQYFEIDINGKIVKSVTRFEFIETTREPEPPPPPPKIK